MEGQVLYAETATGSVHIAVANAFQTSTRSEEETQQLKTNAVSSSSRNVSDTTAAAAGAAVGSQEATQEAATCADAQAVAIRCLRVQRDSLVVGGAAPELKWFSLFQGTTLGQKAEQQQSQQQQQGAGGCQLLGQLPVSDAGERGRVKCCYHIS